jgi:hypothetical protein
MGQRVPVGLAQVVERARCLELAAELGEIADRLAALRHD